MPLAQYITRCEQFLIRLEALQEQLLRYTNPESPGLLKDLIADFLDFLKKAEEVQDLAGKPTFILIRRQKELLQSQLQNHLELIQKMASQLSSPVHRIFLFEKQYRLKKILKHHITTLRALPER